MLDYNEIKNAHTIKNIRAERKFHAEHPEAGIAPCGKVHQPNMRSNASIQSVAKSARLSADHACREYRIARDMARLCQKTSEYSMAQQYRAQSDILRSKWQTLEEIAQHLERLS